MSKARLKAVQADLQAGYVAPAAARRDYGVEITGWRGAPRAITPDHLDLLVGSRLLVDDFFGGAQAVLPTSRRSATACSKRARLR